MSTSLPLIGGIEDFLKNTGTLINPPTQQQQLSEGTNRVGNFLRGSLPVIGSIAAPIAADIVTGGAGIPADMALSAGGYNAGRFAESKLGGNPYNPTSTENLINTGLVGGTQGLGEGATQLAGKALQSSAEKAALNEFKPSTTLIKNFPQQHGGMGFLDYLNKFKNDFGWNGKAADFGDQVLNPLNTQYSDALKGQTIDPQAFKQSVDTQTAFLRKQGGTTSNKTADQLQAEYDDLMSKNKLNNPTTPIDAPLFNSYKSDLYKSGSKIDLSKPVAERDAQLQLADIMRQHLNATSDNAGGNLAQIGLDSKAAHVFNDLGQAQTNLSAAGKGSAPGGLIGTLLRTPFEAAIGAALGHLVPGGDLIGAGVTPFLSESILRNPAVQGALPGIESAVGKGLQSNIGEKILPAIGNTSLHILGEGISNNQDYYTNNSPQDKHDTSIPQNPEENPPEITNDTAYNAKTGHWSVPTDISKFSVPAADNLMTLPQWQKAQADFRTAEATRTSPIDIDKDNFWLASKKSDWETAQGIRQAALNSRLTPDAISFMQEYPQDLQSANALKDIIQKYKGVTGIQNFSDLIKYAEANNDPQVGVAMGMMNSQQAAQTHQTLGRVTQFDINFLQNTPSPTDSKNLALAKIDRFAKNAATSARQFGGPYQYMIDQGLGNTPGLTSKGLPANNTGTVPIQP